MGKMPLATTAALFATVLLALVIIGSRPSTEAHLLAAVPTPGQGAMTIYAVTNPNGVDIAVHHIITDAISFSYDFTSTVPAGATVEYHLCNMAAVPSPFVGEMTLQSDQSFTAVVTGYDYPPGCSATPTVTFTPTAIGTATSTATATNVGTATATTTATRTRTATVSPTVTRTRTATATRTRTATATRTRTATATATTTRTPTATATDTAIAASTATATVTPSVTAEYSLYLPLVINSGTSVSSKAARQGEPSLWDNLVSAISGLLSIIGL